MKPQVTKTKKNHMELVWCPLANASVPGNSVALGGFRCTKCGQVHGKAKP